MPRQLKRLENRPYDPYGPSASPGDELEHLAPAHFYMRAAAPARRETRPAQRDAARILLAETDAYTRRLLRVLLQHPHIALMEAEDGDGAIDLLSMRSFDLVILSLDMPHLAGPETLAWIRRSPTPWSDVPIIGLAGDGSRKLVGQLWAHGLTDWLAKPLVRSDLEQKVQGLLPGLFEAGV